MNNVEEMKFELLKIMRVYSDDEASMIVCKWCDSDMESEENHRKNCFAARVLGRPSRLK